MTKAKKRGPRRAAGERLRKYSRAFPTTAGTHNYLLKIPTATWAAALDRARGEQTSIRVVLLTCLDRYAKGPAT